MILDPAILPWSETYKLLTGCVVPRPIAWVSTCDGEGRTNLAPFSFFTVICPNPPLVCFAPMRHADSGVKDTLRNVLATGEFVINIVSFPLAERMSQTGEEYPPDVSEFAVAGLTPAPSAVVRPPRVMESPVQLECVREQVLEFGQEAGGGNLVIGRVVRIHIRDGLLSAHSHMDFSALDAVGRMAGAVYSRTTELFRLKPPQL